MQRRLGARARAINIWLMAPLLGFALFVGVFVSIAAPVAQAATTSSTLNFQARLLNSAGGIVPDGNYNIEFKIYNADSTTGSQGSCSGACLWMETRTGANVVPVINGYFSVNLGSVTAFGSINWDQQLWLTMRIGGTGTPSWDGEMQNSGHSIALTALPYAFTAGQLALTSGAHRGTLGFNTVANDPNILLPDASGTICLQTSSACGFETTTGTDFIQNQNASPQTANFNITGTGVIGTSLQVPLVQTADSAAGNTTAITLRSGNETGSSLTSGSVTIKSGDAAGGTNSSSGNIIIDSGSKSGTGTTGTISIGTTNASAVNIGLSGKTTTVNGALTAAQTITASGGITVAAGQSILLTGSGTRPGSPADGTLYYDTSTHQLIEYSSYLTKWVAAPKSDTFIVAASNSTQAEKDAADFVASGTDDGATINNALSALPASGGSVYLMEGTYTLAATSISVPDNTTLSGSGYATLLKFKNSAGSGTHYAITNSDTSTGTNVTVQNLLIDGNRTNQSSGGFFGIYFNGMGGGSGSSARSGGKITNVIVQNIYSNVGIDLNGSSNNTITGNTVLNAVYGIGISSSSSNNNITGNTIQGNTSVGIYMNSGSGNTITGNTIQGNNEGMEVGTSNNTITGNIIQGSSSYGIYLYGASNTIASNNFYDNGGATANNGIYLNGATKNSITGNDITDSSCSTTCYAINISDSGSTGNYISANHFLGDGTHTASIANPNNDIETFSNQPLSENGDADFRNATNSTTAFQVQTASGTALLNVDTSTPAITLSANTTVGGSNTLTVNGGLTTLGAGLTETGAALFKANSTTGFQVQDSSSSKAVMTVDTSGDQVTLGKAGASGLTGKLTFYNAAGSHTVSIQGPSSDPASSFNLTLPSALPGSTQCLQSDNTGAISFTTCVTSAAVNTIGTYSHSNNYADGASITGSTLTLGAADATHPGLIDTQAQTFTGDKIFQSSTNSTTAFQIQNSTPSALFNVNTLDGYVINNGVDNLGNEIQNPSFESSGTTDATGWYTPSATQVITNSSANAHSGNYELQVTGNSSTHAVTTPYFAVHPGDTIYAEAWVKNSAGATGDAGMYIEFDDQNKASTTFSNADTGLPGTSYVKKTITTTVPAGSYFLRLAASVKATATAGTFYFDDFYLKKANEPAPLLITNTSSTAFQVQNSSSVTVLGVDATTGKIFSNIANGGSAVGFTLNTTNTYSTAGAKLLSVQNNGTEEFSVDKDGNIVNAGNINIGSGKQFQIGGTQIATTNLSDGGQIAMKNAANTFSSTNSFQVTNTNGFQVQDAAGSHTYIQADTNGGTLYLGNTQTGSTVQIGNSTGAAVTQTINIGSTNTTASSASTITIGSTIGGSLTLQPGGGIIVAAGALGTADNTSYLCRNSSNKLATCITTGTGVAFVNGGNTLGSLTGSLASLGTKDANSLQIITNNTGRATFDQSNNLYLGNADGSGTNAAPNNFNVKGTGSATTGTAGGDVNLYGGAGNTASTGSAGGNISINGGAAGGTGNNAGGNITLVAGLNTGVGAAGNVTVKNAANSASAFQVQTTGSAAVFSVNTSTPTVTVAGGTVFASNTYTSGANSTITQSLVDNNTTISATATATGLTFTVPSPTTATTGRLLYVGNGGTNSFVLNIGSTTFTLAPGSSATLLYIGSGWTDAGIDASTLQLGYTNSIGGTTPEIKLDSTRSTLNIQDADSTVGADILDVNASNGGGGGLGTVVFGVGNTGATKVHTTGSGSTTAFVVQDASNNNFIAVDTTSGGNSVTIDSDTGAAGTIKIGNVGGHAQTVNIGLTASNASNSTINIATNTNASATNTITIGSNGNAANAVNIEGGNTGGINLGNTDVAHTFNIGNGGSTTTQTVNIGSNSGSSVVNLKSDAGINIKTNSSTNNGVLVQSVTTNSTAALQVQNSSNNSLFNIDTTSNYITLGSTSQALTATQGVKIYAGAGTNSAVDLLATADSSSNSFYYGANNSRAQFGYDGVNGAASVKAASGKGFELQVNANAANSITVNSSGQTTFHTNTDSTAGFVVQNSGNATVLSVDTSGRALRVMENGGSTNYALIYYDTATSTANYTANTGTVAVGTGAGGITITSGASSAVNITANAASNWKTNTGTLTLQSGSGSSDFLILNAGGSNQIQVSGTSILKFGSTTADPTCVNGAIYYNTTTPQFRGCVNGTWQNLASITPTLQTTYNSSTGSTTPEIKLNAGGTDTGGVDIQDADSTIGGILFAVRGSNAGGLGTALFNVTDASGNNVVQIGSSSGHSTGPVVLGLDNYSNSGADPTGVVGALYYNGTNGKFRCYDGTWRDCMTGFNEISKTSDQAATQSSTTFQNDNTLLFTMAASTNYVFDAWIPMDTSNATATGKYTFTVPTGAVLNISGQSYSSASASTICNITSSAQTGCTLASSAVNFIQVRGFVRNGSTAGNLQFQFAQNTSTAASFPVVKAGAVLSWRNAN